MAIATSPPPLRQQIKIDISASNPARPLIADHQFQDRTSFSSFRENNHSTTAQAFFDSKTSSYGRASEEAIDDLDEFVTNAPQSGPKASGYMSSLTNPNSVLHGHVCPCVGFTGWKQITIGGRTASRSSGDLRKLGKIWAWETLSSTSDSSSRVDVRSPAGQAPIEKLPVELLSLIIGEMSSDVPPNGFTPRNMDLISLLLTSRVLHATTLATLYDQITIPHSVIFKKFLSHISKHPALGTIVRRLDFSHFNPRIAGMTARERAATPNLTAATLLECIELTPHLREFLAQEHIDNELSAAVLTKLLSGSLSGLHALDFCGCSSAQFRDSLSLVLTQSPSIVPASLSITRLSFHECTILEPHVYSTLLRRLPHLTHLDLAHTRVTDEALMSIPTTARINHLNLSRCASLSGETVVEFLATHRAVQGTLVYLNLSMDAKSHEMLSAHDVRRLLNHLNQSTGANLRSLNMKGSKMNPQHVDSLLPLTAQLEELGLGRHIDLNDITKMLSETTSNSSNESGSDTASCNSNEVGKRRSSALKYLDLSDLSLSTGDMMQLFSTSCPILTLASDPLEVIEVSSEVLNKLNGRIARLGWVTREAGRRGWLVRDWSAADATGTKRECRIHDNGKRSWKMGASYWGMRKLPVAKADVGGMYGLYMFKR